VVLLDAVRGGAMVVEVRYVFSQHSLEVATAKDQHTVQQLAAYGADPSCGDRVRPGRSHRRAQDADALVGEQASKMPVNLLSQLIKTRIEPRGHRGASADSGPAERPRRRGFAVMPRRWTRRVACCTTKLDVAPAQQQGVDAEKVGGENVVCLGSQELSPARAAAAGRRVDAGSLQDQPHGAGCKRVAEFGEFSLDPVVPPVEFSEASLRISWCSSDAWTGRRAH
jgi:hypothetical protein